MGLRKEDFAGTGKVFAFTLRQMLKNRANCIAIVIFLLMALFSVPVMTLINGGFSGSASKEKSAKISKIYYINESSWQLSPDQIAKQDQEFAKVPFEEADFSMEAFRKSAEDYLKSDEVLLYISEVPAVEVYGTESVNLEYESLASAAGSAIWQSQFEAAAATKEQMEIAQASFDSNTDTMTGYYKKQSGPGAGARYGIQYAYAILLMVLCMFTSSYIIQAVIEEKASKLVELLMVSVKPLALIMGKILAVMLYVFGLLLAMGICMGISGLLTALFTDVSPMLEMVKEVSASLGDLRIDPFLIAAVLISLVLGYFTFSIISGLAGCSCSTMEDMESASMNVVVVLMGAYLISVFTINVPDVAVVISLIPVLSIFCAPVAYVCGNIGAGVLLLSWVIQILTVLLLFGFCARIYQSLVLYKGRKMKWSEMFHLARTIGKEQNDERI